MQKIGLIVGKFYPLHQGHLNMIFSAKMQVDILHVIVCSETERDHTLFLESAFTKAPTSDDRVQWAQSILQDSPNIIVHGFNEDGIPAYPNGWQAWSDRLQQMLTQNRIYPTLIFSSEPQDKTFYEEYFKTEVQLVDPPRFAFPVSATKIRTEPFRYWAYIPAIIRPFFTRTILIERNAHNHVLVDALIQLYSSVEITHYAKIVLQSFRLDQLKSALSSYQDDGRVISGLIGTHESIDLYPQVLAKIYQKSCINADDNKLINLPPYLLINTSDDALDKAVYSLEQFKKMQTFINKILNEK